jgi:tRNA dimethylallyltransferase
MHSTTYLDCWFLTGATASGKTQVGMELARLLNAEIVALDSMTIYREMDIGTAKPSLQDRSRVPHHLIDIVNPDEEYSLAAYVEDVAGVVREIRGRGRQPLFVGGTPLYLKSLLRGIFRGPPADWGFRQAIRAEIDELGVQPLYERLQMVDPLSAAKLPPNDVRRIVRALEVYKLTGQPISHWQSQFEEGVEASKCRVFVLRWPRPELHERINRRVEQMFGGGLLEEVRALREKYGGLSRTAAQAVGYLEVLEHLEHKTTLDRVRSRVAGRTRQFAKRQETWFRGLSECRFIECRTELEAPRIAEEILRSGQSVEADDR